MSQNSYQFYNKNSSRKQNFERPVVYAEGTHDLVLLKSNKII